MRGCHARRVLRAWHPRSFRVPHAWRPRATPVDAVSLCGASRFHRLDAFALFLNEPWSIVAFSRRGIAVVVIFFVVLLVVVVAVYLVVLLVVFLHLVVIAVFLLLLVFFVLLEFLSH